ncbi:MAG: SMI1/KNR4 family protein [Spirochaetales bacterium]|nr:SMI1/KNR4 family protein [Spirochaetales bacterium]
MQDIWDRIESWLKKEAPGVNVRLLPGAADNEIHVLEEFLHITFPDDVKASFKIHNGQHDLAVPLIGDWQLFSLIGVERDWKLMKKMYDKGDFSGPGAAATGNVRPEWWIPGWIAVASNGAGDLLCLDMDPAPGGRAGQIVTFWHMDSKRAVLAESFREWLLMFARDLENGQYRVENGSLIHAESL